MVLLEILIFKGLTARRLYKLFGVKGLTFFPKTLISATNKWKSTEGINKHSGILSLRTASDCEASCYNHFISHITSSGTQQTGSLARSQPLQESKYLLVISGSHSEVDENCLRLYNPAQHTDLRRLTRKFCNTISLLLVIYFICIRTTS
jgi:hypothetical protein